MNRKRFSEFRTKTFREVIEEQKKSKWNKDTIIESIPEDFESKTIKFFGTNNKGESTILEYIITALDKKRKEIVLQIENRKKNKSWTIDDLNEDLIVYSTNLEENKKDIAYTLCDISKIEIEDKA